MSRALAALVCTTWLASASVARADTIARSIQRLSDTDVGYKVHLAAALALSKSTDPRAVIAVSDALARDGDAELLILQHQPAAAMVLHLIAPAIRPWTKYFWNRM